MKWIVSISWLGFKVSASNSKHDDTTVLAVMWFENNNWEYVSDNGCGAHNTPLVARQGFTPNWGLNAPWNADTVRLVIKSWWYCLWCLKSHSQTLRSFFFLIPEMQWRWHKKQKRRFWRQPQISFMSALIYVWGIQCHSWAMNSNSEKEEK